MRYFSANVQGGRLVPVMVYGRPVEWSPTWFQWFPGGAAHEPGDVALVMPYAAADGRQVLIAEAPLEKARALA